MRTILRPAALLGLMLCSGAASAMHLDFMNPTKAPAATAVRYHKHFRGGSAMFRHWCAYNCYAVPPCCGPSFYGHYGYSHYAYDEDIPFRHRFDRDASPIDNVDAFVYRYTGEPVMRAFERIY